jgi:hypothetical protein
MSTTTATTTTSTTLPQLPTYQHTEHRHETIEKPPIKVEWKTVPLAPWITTARQFATDEINMFVKYRNDFAEQYNENVRPVNRSLHGMYPWHRFL